MEEPPPYEPVEHTADLAYLARGRSLPELYENAALGLTAQIVDPAGVVPREEERIEAEGDDAEELLVAWLQEILYRFEIHRRLFARFRVERCSPPRLVGAAWGETYDPERHTLGADVKAATYHDLRIRTDETPSGSRYIVRIVLDI